jgi:hypothetical protein
MVMVLREMYPSLKSGRDYTVAHFIDDETGEQKSDPFIVRWNSYIPRPSDAAVYAEFRANEAHYRSAFLRMRRDYALKDQRAG